MDTEKNIQKDFRLGIFFFSNLLFFCYGKKNFFFRLSVNSNFTRNITAWFAHLNIQTYGDIDLPTSFLNKINNLLPDETKGFD